MAYCAYTDIQNMTGTKLTPSVLGAMIDQADRMINGKLAPLGLTGGTNDTIKSASIFLSMALVRERERGDGTRPGTQTIGDLLQSDNIDADISGLTKRAWELVDVFIDSSTSKNTIRTGYVYKVN